MGLRRRVLSKRVIYLVQGLGTGGLERVVLHLASGMVRRGHQVTICCYDKRGELARSAEDIGAVVDLLPRKPGLDLWYILRLAGWLRQRGVDVLHMHNETALFYGTLAGILAKVECLIYTEHDGVFPRSLRARWANRFLVGRLRQAVAVSQAVKDLWCRSDGIDPVRVVVVPNGVPDVTSPLGRDRSQGGNEVRIGCISRLSREKGVDVLMAAFRQVASAHSGARMVLVGDGLERAALEAMSRQFGLDARVQFLGMRDDVPSILRNLDVFVLPSRTEGLPMALLEAMAAGLPIVATAVGGVPEAIRDGETGILVPPERPDELAGAILRLASDEALRNRLAAGGRQTFLNRYELSRMVGAYERLMEG
jgi:glycosyltransferase involved in cell wall biosynthesis